MRPLLLVFALVPGLAACLDDTETSSAEQDETVVSQPTPSAGCSNCSIIHAGQPLTISTSFEGECQTLWSEYPCQLQDYSVTATCDQPCTSGDGSFHGSGSFDIVPLTSASMEITLTFQAFGPLWGSVPTARVMTIEAGPPPPPDRLKFSCTSGKSHTPCTTGVNQAPIDITYTVYAGSKKLVLDPKQLEVESSISGGLFNSGLWTLRSENCDYHQACVTLTDHLDLTASYGNVVADPISLDVEYKHRLRNGDSTPIDVPVGVTTTSW